MLTTDFDITRIAVTNPAVADAVVVKPREVLVDGKGSGTVSLIVWGANERKHYDLVVDPGVTTLQQNFQQLFPTEDIDVAVTDEAVILSGERLEQRRHAARRRTGQGGDAEALGDQHAGAAQRLAEQAGDAAGALRRGEPQRPAAVGPHAVQHPRRGARALDHAAVRGSGLHDRRRRRRRLLQFSDFLNIFLFSQDQGIGGVLKALQGRGFLQSLAEPNLIAYNGQEASFLAGGEIPIPLVSGIGQVSVQYKEFGVRLTFTPTIAGDVIRLAAAARGEHARLHQRHRPLRLPHPGAEHPPRRNRRRAARRPVVRHRRAAEQPHRRPIARRSRCSAACRSSARCSRAGPLRAEQTELMVLVTPRLVRALDPDEVPTLPVRPGAFINPSDEENEGVPGTTESDRPGLLDAPPPPTRKPPTPPGAVPPRPPGQ